MVKTSKMTYHQKCHRLEHVDLRPQSNEIHPGENINHICTEKNTKKSYWKMNRNHLLLNKHYVNGLNGNNRPFKCPVDLNGVNRCFAIQNLWGLPNKILVSTWLKKLLNWKRSWLKVWKDVPYTCEARYFHKKTGRSSNFFRSSTKPLEREGCTVSHLKILTNFEWYTI